MAKRITMIFFAWSLIYLLPLNIGAFMITGVGPDKGILLECSWVIK